MRVYEIEQVPIDAVRWVSDARHSIEARTGAQISQQPDQPCVFLMFGEEDAVDEARQEIQRIVSDAVDASQTVRVKSRQGENLANFAHRAAMNESINFLLRTVNAPSEYYGSDCGKEEPLEFKPPLKSPIFAAADHHDFKIPELPAKPYGRHGLRIGDEKLRYVKGTTMTVKQYACTKCDQPFWTKYKKNGKDKYGMLEDPTGHRCIRSSASQSRRSTPYGRPSAVVKQEVDYHEPFSRAPSVTSSAFFGYRQPKPECDDFGSFSRASSATSSQKASERKFKCTMPDGTSYEVYDPQEFARFRKVYDEMKKEE